jgi:hypothetical protein
MFKSLVSCFGISLQRFVQHDSAIYEMRSEACL